MIARIFAILVPVLLSLQWGVAGAGQENGLVPVQIKRILLIGESPAVLLVDEAEKRFMLIFIDFFMANAIRMGMRKETLERPLTHDLIGIFLRHLGAKVTKITITELKNNTYYALITLEVNAAAREIDARPSDALAIAVRMKIPIFAAPDLLKTLGDQGRPGGKGGKEGLPRGRSGPRAST